MTSSNGDIFHVTGPLCGEFTGPGEFPTQRPVTRSFDVFFDLRLNKRLSKQPWGWWFETPSWTLRCQCNDWTMSEKSWVKCSHLFSTACRHTWQRLFITEWWWMLGECRKVWHPFCTHINIIFLSKWLTSKKSMHYSFITLITCFSMETYWFKWHKIRSKKKLSMKLGILKIKKVTRSTEISQIHGKWYRNLYDKTTTFSKGLHSFLTFFTFRIWYVIDGLLHCDLVILSGMRDLGHHWMIR